jgi:hypothetical protein
MRTPDTFADDRGTGRPTAIGVGLRGIAAAARSEVALARAAIGVIAFHVLDDNFVQPEPGTSAADHLVSGLVPFAVLLVFAMVYSRLRAGLRGAVAIPLALLSIVAGVGEAGYYSLQVGPCHQRRVRPHEGAARPDRESPTSRVNSTRSRPASYPRGLRRALASARPAPARATTSMRRDDRQPPGGCSHARASRLPATDRTTVATG